MGVAVWVARGNIQQICYSPQMDRTAFALWAHAAPSGECNYCSIHVLLQKLYFVSVQLEK